MAMTADEHKRLEETISSLGAMTLALAAALRVLNEEVPNFRDRTLTVLASAAVDRGVVVGDTDPQTLLRMATQFISLL
jgi:hypothetical protein